MVQAMLSLDVARFGINTRVALDLVKACAALPESVERPFSR
jgi:hypothetical protein